jgi:hypothetical protein
LPDDVWRVPDGWSPPARQANFSATGMIPWMSFTDDQLAALKPAGRPATAG